MFYGLDQISTFLPLSIIEGFFCESKMGNNFNLSVNDTMIKQRSEKY